MEQVGTLVHSLWILRSKSFPWGCNLLKIRVKKRVECKCLQIDDAVLLEHFISIFGITAVVGC